MSEPAVPSRRVVAAWRRGSHEFGRGLGFFDAIYGFAATLLVVGLDQPPASAWTSLQALAASGLPRQLFVLALSFVVITAFWRLNVAALRRLAGLDAPVILLNLLSAFFVILLPFMTQAIGDSESSQYPIATAAYALNIAAASLARIAMVGVARARGLERVPLSRRDARIRFADELVTPVVFLVSVPVALVVGSSAAEYVWLSLLVLAPLSGVLAARATGTDPVLEQAD